MRAVEENYPLARRWFVRKAEVLGLDKLQLADQYAPVGSDRRVEWTEAVAIVDDTLRDFSPRLGDIFRTCLDRGHVDAEPRPGKVGGAYCNTISKTVLPYVLMNYTDQLRDVITLAHEFGHAVHGTLSLERQPYRAYHTGLALAEVPSTFTQLLAVERLIEQEDDPSTRVMLLADRAESAMASIFRQTMMARFEQRAYGIRGEGKALTSDRLAEMWIEENERYYGDSLDLPEGYRLGWSYIPHFIHVRFYTYAYAFAHLVAFSLPRGTARIPSGSSPRGSTSSGTARRARRRICSRRSASISATRRRGRSPSASSTAASRPPKRASTRSTRLSAAEQLPVPLGDDLGASVDHSDGGLVVDCVRRDRDSGRPLLHVGHGLEALAIDMDAHREVDESQRPVAFPRHIAALGDGLKVELHVAVVGGHHDAPGADPHVDQVAQRRQEVRQP